MSIATARMKNLIHIPAHFLFTHGLTAYSDRDLSLS